MLTKYFWRTAFNNFMARIYMGRDPGYAARNEDDKSFADISPYPKIITYVPGEHDYFGGFDPAREQDEEEITNWGNATIADWSDYDDLSF